MAHGSSETTRGWRRVLRSILGLIAGSAAAVGFWLFCDHMREGAITADWAWLYSTGLYLWAHGLPAHDIFTWTHPDRAWVLYQWLFEALAAPIYWLLGPSLSVFGVCVLGALMYAIVPAWHLGRRGVPPLLTLALGGLVLIPVSVNFGLRPMLASNLALLAQWLVLERWRDGRLSWPVTAAALALVYALWANSHLGFTLGLTSLALFCLADLIAPAQIRRPQTGRARIVGAYIGLLAVAVLATGANPYGWSLYGYILHLSFETKMNAHIHELMPPRLSNGYMDTGLVLIVCYALAILATLFIPVERRRLGWAGPLHVALFTIGTVDALRMVIWAGLFYALAAPPVFLAVCRGLRPRAAAWLAAPMIYPRPVWLVVLLVGAGILLGGSAATAGRVQVASCRRDAPGIRYLDAHLSADARWFSSETVGSCTHLIAPARRVFIDTRFDMYPEAFVLDWFYAYEYRSNWQRLFKRWEIQAALLSDHAPLVPELKADPDFSERAVGNGMLFFEKTQPGNSDPPPMSRRRGSATARPIVPWRTITPARHATDRSWARFEKPLGSTGH